MTIEKAISIFKDLSNELEGKNKAKAEKMIALSEIASSLANRYPKGLKRISRLNKAYKKRAFVKSKFYNKLESEKMSIKLMPILSASQLAIVQSQPIPRFEQGGFMVR